MTASSNPGRCHHAKCRCSVEASLAYCCEYCARADQAQTEREQTACDCGHPECRSAQRDVTRT